MKFYGNGMVWGETSVLCKFDKGELQTSDSAVIRELMARGYKHDAEPIDTVRSDPEPHDAEDPCETCPTGTEEQRCVECELPPTQEPPEPSRADKSRQELLSECKQRGIKYDKRMNKTELIKLLDRFVGGRII